MESEWYDTLSCGVVAVIANKCEDLLKDLLYKFYLHNPGYLRQQLRERNKFDELRRYEAFLRLTGDDKPLNIKLDEADKDFLREALTTVYKCAQMMAAQVTAELSREQLLQLMQRINESLVDDPDPLQAYINSWIAVRNVFTEMEDLNLKWKMQIMIARETLSGKHVLNNQLTLH